MSVSDILVINKRGQIIFEYGSGKLIQAKQIVATLTQALSLFGKNVINEELQFVRFHKQRLFFIISIDDHVIVRLVDKDLLSKQFVPGMKIVLQLSEKLLKIPEAVTPIKTLSQTTQENLGLFYEIVSFPEDTLIVVPRNVQGFLSLIILFAGLFFDLAKNVDLLLSNIVMLNPEEILDTAKYSKKKILVIGIPKSYVKINSSDSVKQSFFIGKDASLNFSSGQESDLTALVALFFGTNSNAERIYQSTLGADVREVAAGLTELPREADSILLETIKESIENSGRNLAKMMYRNLIKKMRELGLEKEGHVPIEYGSEQQNLQEQLGDNSLEQSIYAKDAMISEKGKIQEQQISKIKSVEPQTAEPLDLSTDKLTSINIKEMLERENKTVQKKQPIQMNLSKTTVQKESLEPTLVTDQSYTTLQTEVVPDVNLNILPDDLGKNVHKILLTTCPILVDTTPYVLGKTAPLLQYAPSIQIQPATDQYVEIIMLVGATRVNDFKKSLSDLESRISAELSTIDYGVKLKIPRINFYMALKGLVWSLFIEYAYQVQKNLQPKTSIFMLPNEGSVCVIPDGITPNRRKQLPKQISEIFEEQKIIETTENENPVTITQSIDILLQKMFNVLKNGKGLGLVPRGHSPEQPQIIEFLLLLSEMCGIGWSRW